MPQQEQRRARPQVRSQEESRRESASQPRTAGQASLQEEVSAKQRQSDLGLEEAQVTAGKDGALNIRVEQIPVPLPNAIPCRFIVTTAAGNQLEVSLEQKSYRKSYQGTSSLHTDITPVAPIGTKGKLVARDLTTGETFERPWTWRNIAGARWGLWALIKRLFT